MTSSQVTAKVCGIIRPISDVEGYPRGHWDQVHNIIVEVAKKIGLEARVVCDAKEPSIIPRHIASNIIENDIVVCDVSTLNANVMLELGLRLALGKAVVVIKDDRTKYSFDTSPIEHVGYPAGLHYYDVLSFKVKLEDKIKATMENYHPFLAAFGPIEVPTLEKVDVPALNMVISRIDSLSRQVSRLSRNPRPDTRRASNTTGLPLPRPMNKDEVDELKKKISEVISHDDFYVDDTRVLFRPGAVSDEEIELAAIVLRDFS